MKKILLILLLNQYIFATISKITINHHQFTIEKKYYSIYDSKGEYMKLYRDDKMLFRLTLSDYTGSCSARSLAEGYYAIKGNIITLYSFWDRQGEANLAPYGARVQTYQVLDSGQLKLTSARVYVESTSDKSDEDSGMRFLFKKPKNNHEKEELNAYVKEIEEEYNAKFVFGDKAKELIAEVQKALKIKRKMTWGASRRK